MACYPQVLDRALRHWTRYVTIPCALGLLSLSIVVSISDNLNFEWTSMRIAPSFALAYGYPLYSLPDHPPWVTVAYGPVFPIAYLPCIFAKDPVTAVSLATMLAYSYILVPIGLMSSLFCRRMVISPDSPKESWVPIFLFFGLLTSFVPSLGYITTRVHVDGPALGLFLMACYFSLRAEEVSRKVSGRLTALAGICAGLSASCKFTLLAGAFALVLFILWALDWRRAAGFALFAVLTVCIVYGWIIWRDGFPAVMHSFRVLGKFPWIKHTWFLQNMGGTPTLADTSTLLYEKVRTFVFLVRDYLIEYGILIVAILALTRLPTRQSAHRGILPSSQLVWVFLCIALVVSPVSIVSVAKYGGAENSRAIFTLPLTLAAVLALWTTAHRAKLSGKFATSAALMGAVVIVAISVHGKLKSLNFGRSMMEESYATVRDYPSQCYFPYDPLAHLLAGDRFRPNGEVIWDDAVAGFPVNKVAFDASMPQRIRYVIVPQNLEWWGFSELRRLLPIGGVTGGFNLEHHRVWGLKDTTHSDIEMEINRTPSG